MYQQAFEYFNKSTDGISSNTTDLKKSSKWYLINNLERKILEIIVMVVLFTKVTYNIRFT